MIRPLQHYLAQVQEHLPFGGSRRARILSEIETHLLESWEDEQSRGLSSEEALALALERFGSPALIGQQFACLEIELRLRQGRQCWQRACLFLMPLLFCCVIGLLGQLGYDAPRQVFIRFTDDLGNELAEAHVWFVGILLVGWLSLGGPFACAISGIQGIATMKNWSRVTWLNLLWASLGLALLLFDLYGMITG